MLLCSTRGSDFLVSISLLNVLAYLKIQRAYRRTLFSLDRHKKNIAYYNAVFYYKSHTNVKEFRSKPIRKNLQPYNTLQFITVKFGSLRVNNSYCRTSFTGRLFIFLPVKKFPLTISSFAAQSIPILKGNPEALLVYSSLISHTDNFSSAWNCAGCSG